MAWHGALEILDLVIRELHTDPKPSLVQRRHVRHYDGAHIARES
jgi:hypothetical protein